MGVTPRVKAYPIVAIFEIGMSEYDGSFIYMPFAEAQAYFNQDDKATAIEALEKGASGFLCKPFTERQLNDALVKLIEG